MSKVCVVLVGGLGRRLLPYTLEIPKPLMPLGDVPILEVVLRQLARAGFDRVILAVNHLAHLIMNFCGDGSNWGLSIEYSHEAEPLGTMGPLRTISDLPENFLVMNGDILCNIDYSGFLTHHQNSGSIFTVLSVRRIQEFDYGVIRVDDSQFLADFEEKPKIPIQVSAGVYGVCRKVLSWIPGSGPFGFDELMLSLIAAGERVAVAEHDGYWMDIGRPADYEQALRDFERMKDNFVS